MSPDAYRFFYRYSIYLGGISLLLFYNLGVGIARYLGFGVNEAVYWLGLVWVLGLLTGTFFLREYFGLTQEQEATPAAGLSPANKRLITSAVFFTVCASVFVLLINTGSLTAPGILLAIIGVAGCVLYALPPIYPAISGYGELIAVVLLANVAPAFSFALQAGELHRFVAMATFPSSGFFLAMVIVLEFPRYASYLRKDQQPILIRLGWQNGVGFHNLLILAGYLVFTLAVIFGFPRFVVTPIFFTLPLGIWQIWYLNQIAIGTSPNWNLLTTGSAGLFGIILYILNFAFWTH